MEQVYSPAEMFELSRHRGRQHQGRQQETKFWAGCRSPKRVGAYRRNDPGQRSDLHTQIALNW